jgi:formate dehydrogenase iron-sulfur subunit
MKGILIDTTRCTGCERCVEACCEAHDMPPPLPARKLSGDGLSSRRLCAVVEQEPGRYVKKQCVHCLDPGCVDACPVGAIERTPEGAVVYDPARCMGCRYCMLACPLGIPRYEWEKQIPYMIKCDMCIDRLREGKLPACVEACPNEACVFGERDDLLLEARRRCSGPGYVNHVWGHEELDGTAVLYISDKPLAEMAWPESVGRRSISSFTWPVISKTPWVGGGVAAFLTGTCWIIRRRMEMQKADNNDGEHQ